MPQDTLTADWDTKPLWPRYEINSTWLFHVPNKLYYVFMRLVLRSHLFATVLTDRHRNRNKIHHIDLLWNRNDRRLCYYCSRLKFNKQYWNGRHKTIWKRQKKSSTVFLSLIISMVTADSVRVFVSIWGTYTNWIRYIKCFNHRCFM